MSSFSISVVERWTGLSADTIRAWERRHGAIRPSRGPGNIRRYGPSDVRRLLLLQEATRRGHAISRVAGLSERALGRLIREDHDALEVLSSWHDQRQSEALSDAYLCSLARLDVDEARRLLLLAQQLFQPLTSTFLEPLLRRVESRWPEAEGGPGVFVRRLFFQQLQGLLFGSRAATASAKVLVTGADRLHGWTLLAALTMLQEGLETILLSPFEDLAWPAGLSGAQYRLVVGTEALAAGAHLFIPSAELSPASRGGAVEAGRSGSLEQLEAVAREWRLSADSEARH